MSKNEKSYKKNQKLAKNALQQEQDDYFVQKELAAFIANRVHTWESIWGNDFDPTPLLRRHEYGVTFFGEEEVMPVFIDKWTQGLWIGWLLRAEYESKLQE